MKKEHLNYFNEALNKVLCSIDVNIPIAPADFENLNVDKKTKDYAVGICWADHNGAFLINIDEYFIEQNYEAEINGKWWYLSMVEGKTLLETICHEIAHIEHWNHGIKHKELMRRLLNRVQGKVERGA